MMKWICTLMISLIVTTSTCLAQSLSDSCFEIEDQLSLALKKNLTVPQCLPKLDRSELYVTIACLNIDFHDKACSTLEKALDQLNQLEYQTCNEADLILDVKTKMALLAERLKHQVSSTHF